MLTTLVFFWILSSSDVSFEHLSLERGLSQSTVLCILQDAHGFLWFGTEAGLNRYDGYGFSQSPLSNNHIHSLHEDEEQRLWVGTDGGLHKYDPVLDRFEPIIPAEITGAVFSLSSSSDGTLWVGLQTGLLALDPERLVIKQRLLNEHQIQSLWVAGQRLFIGSNQGLFLLDGDRNLSSLGVWSVSCLWATERHLWIGTIDQGLFQLDLASQKAFQIPGLGANHVRALFQDRDGLLWIGTEHGGLSRLNQNSVESFVHEPRRENSLSENTVRSIYQDRSGVLWFGAKGVDKYVPWLSQFKAIQQKGEQGLSDNMVRSVLEDGQGTLWVGTAEGGLHRIAPDGTVHLFEANPNDERQLPGKEVLSLHQDRRGRLWVGSTGLSLYENGTFRTYALPQQGGVRALANHEENGLWVASDQGLFLFQEGQFQQAETWPEPLRSDVIRCLLWRRDGSLLVGSDQGLFQGRNGTFSLLYGTANGLSHNRVLALHEDELGQLWVGTHQGLNLVKQSKPQVFSIEHGLPNGVIYAILADDDGHLWMSTNLGICHFSKELKVIHNYDVRDGLSSNEFNAGAAFKSARGLLYFGGINGLNYFNPKQLVRKPYQPQIMLTDLKILGRSVSLLDKNNHGHSILKQSIASSKEIDLTWAENVFSFEFAASSYAIPGKNRFAYKLEGFQEDWVDLGARNFTTFTNLSPGPYVFRVRGRSDSGVWSDEGFALNIHIRPPFWKTKTAFFLYFAAFCVLLYGIRSFELHRERLQHDLNLERLKADHLAEQDRIKSRFFSNISHEFRTPLTLILGPLKRLQSKDFDGDPQRYYEIMTHHGQRLLKLVNQLLDLSKLEAGRLQVQFKNGDLVLFLQNMIAGFQPLAERRSVSLQLHSDVAEAVLAYDRDKLEKILTNLLSNALKFAPEGGEVSLSLQIKAQEYQITVCDNGPGIEEEYLTDVFDRFFQVGPQKEKGSGIGLALVRELVLLHGGHIQVSSEAHVATRFEVCLPKVEGVAAMVLDEVTVLASEETLQFEAQTSKPAAPLVLVVEDHPDVRAWTVENLGEKFRTMVAKDGQEGYQQAKTHVPDVIISDVVMPEMDGFELCEKIKTNPCTSHIPVILLTAMAEQEQRLSGLAQGADAYLVKPFDPAELVLRVENLMTQMQRLRVRFAGKRETPARSLDEQFMDKLENVLEEYLSDTDFTVETFAAEMSMSRVQLYRKLQALTGKSPSVVIRETRLNRAAELLKQRTGSIAEITFEVGFLDPSYFSKCFKKQFGCSPSEWL